MNDAQEGWETDEMHQKLGKRDASRKCAVEQDEKVLFAIGFKLFLVVEKLENFWIALRRVGETTRP